MNSTRRDALRETKRERLNRRMVEIFAAGILTGIIPALGIGLVNVLVEWAI